MNVHHFYEAQQLTPEFLHALFNNAEEIRLNLGKHTHDLEGKILATLFYEPSTRTRLSFEAAMLRLGGQIITTENAEEFSSVVKGESLEDTVRIIGQYTDGIVIRHNEEGAAKRASEVSPVPIINAGDGKGQHPTQALLDVYTIHRELDKISGINVALVGDLASGRTTRSLCYLLGKFENVNLTFVSPDNLKMKDDIKTYLRRHDTSFQECSDLNKVLSEVDIIYMTRIQKERISLKDYEKVKGKFVINQENFPLIKPEARIMHPLPHVEEIDLSVNIEQTDDRIAYFRQSENGLYVRMALLNYLLK